MAADYNEFHSTVAELEGGYQNRLDDHGNQNSMGIFVGTNFGISAPVYEEWIKRPPTVLDMKNLTKATAKQIFKKNYWNRLNAGYIQSQAVAETLVDHGINAGTGAAAKVMQKVLNEKFGFNLSVDGAIGPISIEAINSVDAISLFQEFNLGREEDYKTKRNKSFWLPIWLRRIESIADKFGIELKKKQS